MKNHFGGVVSSVFTACAFLAVFLIGASAFGAEPGMIVGWSFPTTKFKENPIESAFTKTGVTSPVMIKVEDGMSRAEKTGGAFGGSKATATSFADAAANNQAISFTIEASSGYAITLSQIPIFKYSRTKTSGAQKGQWQYAIQGGDYIDLGTEISWTTKESGKADAVDLSAIPVIGPGSNVTIRLVLWGATGSRGAWYIMADETKEGEYFSVEGTVEGVGST